MRPPSLVLVIVCAGVVLASLDLFIVNVAMPSMARDLHQPNLSTLSWVLNAYAIVYASLLVLFGRLSEARARQNGFLLGALIFTLGLGGLRRRDEPGDADRVPRGPGDGRGAADAGLAEPGARDHGPREAPRRGPRLDRRRRRGGGARARWSAACSSR